MDTQRSKKSRSLGINPSSAKTSTEHQLSGDRHKSTPPVTRRRQSDTRAVTENSVPSSRPRAASKARNPESLRSQATPKSADDSRPSTQRNSFASQGSGHSSTDAEDLPVLNFAVIGHPGVGRTNFSCNALDLRRPSSSAVAASKVSLGGTLYRLQLIEFSPEDIEIVDGEILWLTKKSTVPIEGAFCLYDVTDRSSLDGIPPILTALAVASVSTCVVPCKVDLPLSNHVVGATFLGQVQERFPSFAIEEASSKSAESAKRGLLKVLKPVIARLSAAAQVQLPETSVTQPNAPVHSFPPRTSSRSNSFSNSRSRSGSRTINGRTKSKENLLSTPRIPEVDSERDDLSSRTVCQNGEGEKSATHDERPLKLQTTNLPRKQPTRGEPQTPRSSTEALVTHLMSPSDRVFAAVPETPDSLQCSKDTLPDLSDDVEHQSYQTFLDMDDESVTDETDDVAEKVRDLTVSDSKGSDTGVPFCELVDRLLSHPRSKGDTKFVSAFLCLYRAFATPFMLLREILERFMKVDQSNKVPLTKNAELLRYLSVLGTWTATYPGDFEDPMVRSATHEFLTQVEKSKPLAPSARQISNNLQIVVADEDDDWAFAEKSRTSRSRSNTKLKTASYSETSAFIVTSDTVRKLSNRHRARADNQSSDSEDEFIGHQAASRRHSGTASSASSLAKAAAQASSQSANNIQHLENARDRAKRLRVTPHIPLGKTQWHQFMGCSVDELATEITRLSWTMYSAIRPRDFIRYVTMPSAKRVRSGQVDYIGLMTKHFNHLALLVSGMILLRDKPKHRARMLEKFMDLAWKVRQLNNYHALGAIVAALNGEEIVRLVQTQSLIPDETHKQAMRLRILMSHQRSHSAYRLAWENSSSERIPFLPRIQEDLTKAVSGNPTFVGTNIKWSKFELIGDAMVNILRSQDMPYTFSERTSRGHDIDKLILETRVLSGSEDGVDPRQELYERSKVVEPTSSASDWKKFDWLRR